MLTYITLDHTVLNLSDLTPAERERLDAAIEAYRARMDYWAFATGPGAQGFVSRQAFETPLFRAIQDLEFRIGIRCGTIGPVEGDDVELDPLRDSTVSIAEAAEQKGVSTRAVHKAIERGELVAGGRPAQISAESLSRWTISLGRQKASFAARDARLNGIGTFKEAEDEMHRQPAPPATGRTGRYFGMAAVPLEGNLPVRARISGTGISRRTSSKLK